MNFICAISNTVIKIGDNVRVFFIQSRIDEKTPFTSRFQELSTGNFKPIGIAYKAICKSLDDSGVFSFDDKYNDSIETNALFEELNDHRSLDIKSINNLSLLFDQINNSRFCLNDGDFVSAMVIHEEIYQEVLKQGSINKSVDAFKASLLTDKYLKIQTHIQEWVDRESVRLHLLLGKIENTVKSEIVFIDDDFIENKIKAMKAIKLAPEIRDDAIYELNEKLQIEKGHYVKYSVQRDRIVDDKYIKEALKEHKFTLQGCAEFSQAKDASGCYHSTNYHIQNILAVEFSGEHISEDNWISTIESLVFEKSMNALALQFQPNRKIFVDQKLQSHYFYKNITKLDIFKDS